jgi:hypothetical protein
VAKILYFIKGSNPTAEERAAAEALGTKMFRNASARTSFIEACDGVAGAVPEAYAKIKRADKPVAAKPATPVPTPAPAADAPVPPPAPAADAPAPGTPPWSGKAKGKDKDK